MEREWAITDDLTPVLNIKGQLRQQLLDWVNEHYQVEKHRGAVGALINMTIDTFLDEEYRNAVGLLAPPDLNHSGFYTEDFERGDIVSFLDKALTYGYEYGSYPRIRYCGGLKPREERH